MEKLIQKIENQIPLSEEAKNHLFTIAKETKVLKGSTLIREGQYVKKTFFVTDGCLRAYSVDKNGKEHTLQFAVKNWWISDFIAIYTGELATLNIECLSDSTVIDFNSQELNDIHTHFPEFEAFQRNNLERHVVSLHKRILNQMQLTAEERYDLFLEQYPDIEQYTRNYHIASYLGVTQQSLSRIRVTKTKK